METIQNGELRQAAPWALQVLMIVPQAVPRFDCRDTPKTTTTRSTILTPGPLQQLDLIYLDGMRDTTRQLLSPA